MRPDLPHVPLEAGAGPDNPPCPACGEPLFPWVGMPVGTGTAHRCEACGLGVLVQNEAPARPDLDAAFDPGTTAGALKFLDSELDDDGSLRFFTRISFQASLTGGAWSALGTDQPYIFTPDAVRDLVANRDQVVTGVRWLPGTGIAHMWQSGINMFTFGQNVALGALGRGHAVPARRRWQRVIDGFISVALAIPAIVIAVPLELFAGLCRRGGAYRARFQVL
ncbi:MAG: hypothetical protein M3Y45_09680 [Actinomycetota bacterium]|nr:hypothetical protein [Actinomycetota bacterium]